MTTQSTLSATFGTTATGQATVRWSDVNGAAIALMHQIGARYDRASYTWTFEAAFLPLVREEAERGIPARPDCCPVWPAAFDGVGRKVKSDYRYETFPATPEEAMRLVALREQHAAPGVAPVVAEPVAEAPIGQSTTSAPPTATVVATVSGSAEPGECMLLVEGRDRFGATYGRVVVAQESYYIPDEPEMDSRIQPGWWTTCREATEAERTSAAFQRLHQRSETVRAAAEAWSQARDARYERERAAAYEQIRQEGREPTRDESLWIDLFAGADGYDD